MHAVILAGGRGVRLRPYTTALPKPLVPIGDDHVIIDIILRQLADQGFRSVTLAINHFGELIKAFVGRGERWGLEVGYAHETEPLSTVGPLFLMRDELPEHFLMMNGDLLTDVRFDELLDQHVEAGAPFTVATHKAEHRVEFGVLDVESDRITGFTEKPSLTYHVSMGIYGLSRTTIEHYTPGIPFGVDQLILDLISAGTYPATFAHEGLWMDIGRPDDYDVANQQIADLLPQLLPSRRLKVSVA